MNNARQGTVGSTRTCPHCKATILESASVCPACRGHLRFDSAATQHALASTTPLRIEGTIRQPPGAGAAEYSVVLSIHNDRGEEITRKVIGVGALQPDESRSFILAVEMFAADGKGIGKGRGH